MANIFFFLRLGTRTTRGPRVAPLHPCNGTGLKSHLRTATRRYFISTVTLKKLKSASWPSVMSVQSASVSFALPYFL